MTFKKILSKIIAILKSPRLISVYSILMPILTGFILVFLFLLYSNSAQALNTFQKLITASFESLPDFFETLYKAAPILMTGLAVGFAFKTGLFNIGASGQYTIGAFASLYAAIILNAPWYVAMLFGMVGGAIWGFIPGFLKSKFNINEVITSIMTNWIALYIVNLFISNMTAIQGNPANKTADLNTVNPSALIPDFGLTEALNTSYANIGFFIAMIFAVIIYVVLNKTTFGFELKACGFNKDASTYAGINAKKNIILAMVISGALAGIGGSLQYLSGTVQLNISANLLGAGFDGIPVALLASSNPIGIILSSFFIAYLRVGGDSLSPLYSTENVDIILSVIIYFSAFALLIKTTFSKILNKKSVTTKVEPDKTEPDNGVVAEKEEVKS